MFSTRFSRIIAVVIILTAAGCMNDNQRVNLPPPSPLVAAVVLEDMASDPADSSLPTKTPEHASQMIIEPAQRPRAKKTAVTVTGEGESTIQLGDFAKDAAPGKTAISGLRLPQALALALLKNPTLAATAWDIRAAEARRLQASLLPNPELDVEVEEFGGKGAASGTKVAETTIQLSQLIELGGKRSRRMRFASIQQQLAAWDYEAHRLRVFSMVSQIFIDVLAAQEKVKLRREMLALAERFSDSVKQRVASGKVAPLQQTKAFVFLGTRRIQLKRSVGELEVIRKRLSATWGTTNPDFVKVRGDLREIKPVPSLPMLEAEIEKNPDLARWVTEIASRRAAVAVERSVAVPDITVGGGARRLNEIDETRYVVGISIPIPIFDRNQGGIREARDNLQKARDERRAVAVGLRQELATAHRALKTAFMEATALQKEVLPLANQAFQAAKAGYSQGKFGYLEVLDAQRTLVETKEQYLFSLRDYHKAQVAVERLIGNSLEKIRRSVKAKERKAAASRKLDAARRVYKNALADYRESVN